MAVGFRVIFSYYLAIESLTHCGVDETRRPVRPEHTTHVFYFLREEDLSVCFINRELNCCLTRNIES